MGLTINLSNLPQKVIASIEAELPSRAVRAANALLNAENNVLRGQRSGRKYGNHTASAPGEPPANWTGHLRMSFKAITNDAHLPAIETETSYAQLLESGGGKLAPRPFKEKIMQEAEPEIKAIYSEPWHIKI